MILSFICILGIFPSMSVYANGENLFISDNKFMDSESNNIENEMVEDKAVFTGRKISTNHVATAAEPNGENNPENSGDNSGSTETTVKSEDNSLSTLTISPGTLSPAFVYNVIDYTASVEEDVTSVSVEAKTSNEKATIESISGNTDLKQGQNTIRIVVKAENGAVATYKIVVTRGGIKTSEEQTSQTQSSEGQTPNTQQPENQDSNAQPSEDQTPNTQQPEVSSDGITIDGNAFNLASTIPEDVIPQDFTKTTITCKGQQIEGLQFEKASLILVYLTTPSLEVKNTLAVYEEASDKIYPFRKVILGEKYIILLEPPADTGLSEDYTQTTASIGEFSNVPVFTNEANKEDFSLIYGASNFGNLGWYQYDIKEETFQRFNSVVSKEKPQKVEASDNSAEMQALQNAYKDLEGEFYKKKDVSRKTIAVMIFIIAVLTVIIANLLLRGRHEAQEEDWEEDFKEEKLSRVRKYFKKENNHSADIQKESKEKERKPSDIEDLDIDLLEQSQGKINEISETEKDWNTEVPEEPKAKVRKRAQMKEDWNTEVPEEPKAKVRKRAQMKEDWDTEVPEEPKAKVRKRAQMKEDWDTEVPEEPNTKTNEVGKNLEKKKVLSQETRPIMKVEVPSHRNQEASQKSELQSQQKPENLKKLEAIKKSEAYAQRKQEMQRKPELQSQRKQGFPKRPETVQKTELQPQRKPQSAQKSELQSQRKQEFPKRPETAQKLELQSQRKQEFPKRLGTAQKSETQLQGTSEITKNTESVKKLETQSRRKQELTKKPELTRKSEIPHQKRIELDDNFEVIDLEDL